MRFLFLLIFAATALAQSGPRAEISHSTEGLRGVSAVSRQIAWASGTHGTYLRTVDGGRTWTTTATHGLPARPCSVLKVSAAGSKAAWLIARVNRYSTALYRTLDGGRDWRPVTMFRS